MPKESRQPAKSATKAAAPYQKGRSRPENFQGFVKAQRTKRIRKTEAERLAEEAAWLPPEKGFTLKSIDFVDRTPLKNQIKITIRNVFQDLRTLESFGPYVLGKGKQSATSKVTKPTAGGDLTLVEEVTNANMHSEMVALLKSIQAGHASFHLGNFTFSPNLQFVTVEPHCGHCTFILYMLGLRNKLGLPTAGIYNLANNCQYPLPQMFEESEELVNRICNPLNAPNGNAIDLLNSLFVQKGAISSWNEVKATQNDSVNLLKILWTTIYECLYEDLSQYQVK